MGSLSPPNKPTIVLIPGSFSPAAFYTHVLEQLSSHGYESVYATLPSIGRKTDGTPAATMAEDAASIQSITSKLAEAGHDILLVTHSYGGICGTESVRGLLKSEREAAGKSGGIVRLMYVTSLVPPVGGSSRTFMGDHLPDQIHVDVSFPYSTMDGGSETDSDLLPNGCVDSCFLHQAGLTRVWSLQGEYMWNEPEATAALTFSDLPRPEGLGLGQAHASALGAQLQRRTDLRGLQARARVVPGV